MGVGESVQSQDSDESGLIAFATLLAIHNIAFDPRDLRHELGHWSAASADDLLRLAKRQDGVRAKRVTGTFERLSKLPLPALANGPDGWFLIGRADGDAILKLGLAYPAVVALSDARITVDGKQVPVTPGMMATADIRTGRRSLLSYLLSPIDEATQEAGRER